jgi:hypothetical protein
VELTHGFRQMRDFGVLTAGAAAHTFRIAQKPYSSYEVVVDSTTGDVGSGLALERLASDGVTVLQNSLPVGGVGYSRSLRWVNATGFVVADEYVRVVSSSCAIPGCGPEDAYRVRAYDTTCVVPRFNNSATQVTILLLQNPTTQPVSGTVYFYGELLGKATAVEPATGFTFDATLTSRPN